MNADRQGPSARAEGGCLCGAVRYRVNGPLRDVIACHCGQCRRWHGHFAAYAQARREDVEVTGEADLRWFRSSGKARRGFCGTCGSSLFWDALDRDTMAIAAGTVDQPTGLALVGHGWVADAADYYRIDDGLPSYPASTGGTLGSGGF